MKKVLFSVIASVLLACTPAFSLEWGGVVKSSTDCKTADFESYGFSQEEDFFIWGKVPLGKNSPFSLVGELTYKAIFDIDNTGVTGMENILDVDIFKLAGNIEFGQASSLNLSLGRFYTSDSTKRLFSQLIDGAQVVANFSWINLSVFGGFTGLINSHVSPMMENDGYVLQPDCILYSVNIPYLVADAKIELPYVMKNTFLLEAMGFFDTRDFGRSRYFGELSVAGPLNTSVYYKFDTVVGFNNNLEFSNYSVLDYYTYPFSNTMFSFGVEYASGNTGPLKAFYPVTSQVASSALSHPALSGVIIPNVGFTISTDNFYAALLGKFVFELPETTITPAGGEVSLTSQFNILSDIKINVSADAYYDITGSGQTNYSASVGAAVSF